MSRHVPIWLVVSLLLCGAVVIPARAQTDVVPPEVVEQLKSADHAEVQKAVAYIKAAFAKDGEGCAGACRRSWLGILIAGKHFEEAESLARQAILQVAHRTEEIEGLQQWRITAFLAAGKPREALSQAKALFNVASMRGTERALTLVMQCLRAVYPNDPDIRKRFRQEQLAGAAPGSSPGNAPADLADDKQACVSPLLQQVAIDPKPFRAAIQEIIAKDDQSQMAKANLLLLAGRVAEARAVCDAIIQGAGELDIYACHENIARCLKAQDGAIGRANAYVAQTLKQLQ